MKYKHLPVMLEGVLVNLAPRSGGRYVDGTLGGGGYTFALAAAVGSTGRVLSIDLDPLAITHARQRIELEGVTNIDLAQGNFRRLEEFVSEQWGDVALDGIVFDLGLSSAQLEDDKRGFSFKGENSLDMAFGPDSDNTADLVNRAQEKELLKIIRDFGEERFAPLITRAIIARRKIERFSTATDLAAVIEAAVPGKFRHGRIHPATKTFQALRIATNEELQSLSEVLPAALKLLKSGGRLAVVSFHSLEDKIVKDFFRNESRDCLCGPEQMICQCGHKARIKTISFGSQKFLLPEESEISANPRARSAKLRVAEKI